MRSHHRERVAHGVQFEIHTEGVKSRLSQDQCVTSASHREIQRAASRRHAVGDRRRPLDHEWRGAHNSVVAAALLTAVAVGFFGLITTTVVGLVGADVSRHISFGIFSTMVTLLAHSMMMFYLIGKGKAVKDAMAEHNVTGDYFRRIAAARKPVFSIATLAMASTMTTAILGASVDTGVLPPMVHAVIAYGAIACNVAAVKIELDALSESARVVDEVNRLLGS